MQSLVPEYNYLGKCIQNIASGMQKGAKIEVEWHPYIGLCVNNIEDIKSIYSEDLVKKNPFSTSIDINVALTGAKMAYAPALRFADTTPQQFIACAKALSEKIKSLLCFYEAQGMGKKALLEKRLDQEVWLLKELNKPHYKVILPKGPESSLQEFSEVITELAWFPCEDSSRVGKFLCVKKDGKIYSGILHDQAYFLTNTLFNFVISDVSIEYNSSFVREFMQENGFTDVSIERKTSPYNDRKNVWIISGIKS